jgi:hypothetical protein
MIPEDGLLPHLVVLMRPKDAKRPHLTKGYFRTGKGGRQIFVAPKRGGTSAGAAVAHLRKLESLSSRWVALVTEMSPTEVLFRISPPRYVNLPQADMQQAVLQIFPKAERRRFGWRLTDTKDLVMFRLLERA